MSPGNGTFCIGGKQMRSKGNRKLLIGLPFSMMLVFGLVVNIRGPINPLIQKDYGINYSQLGLVMVLFSIGSSFATFSGGILIEKFSLKKVFWAGLFIEIIGLVAIKYINEYYLLTLIMGIIGLGMGVLNVSANTLASRIFIKDKGKMMNIFHLFFGVGGIVAPIYATQLIKRGFKWESSYFFSILLILSLLLFSLFSRFPEADPKEEQNNTQVMDLIKDMKVVIFILMFFFYVGAEIGLTSWLGLYLDDVQGRSEEEISFYIFLFFLLFTVGRFLGSIIVEKIGYLRLVLISSVSAIISILLAIIGPDYFAFFFSLTGLFLSIDFPTMQAAIFEIFDENISAIIGITLTAGGLGNIFMANWLPGLINDLIGIKLGFILFIAYLLILVGAILFLKYKYIGQDDKLFL
jgi:fucose permease